MSFRDNLQYLRAERIMTQEQLAMLLGVSRQSVTKWEAERSSPEMDKLLKICQIFDCSLDELVRGDVTQRGSVAEGAQMPTVPAGPPQDICGYDEHQREMAWKVPTGIACILVGLALGFLVEGIFRASLSQGYGGVFLLCMSSGILIGLAFLIPAGMAHSAFVKAHPFIEDFYTEDDKLQTRTVFSRGLIGGIAAIFVGIGILIVLGETMEDHSLFFFFLFVALGVWSIVHYGMLLGRINVTEYNKSASDELEIEDIMNAKIDTELKDALLQKKRHEQKLGAVCGVIMMIATVVGMALLLIPVFSSSDLSNFKPEGTSAMWFWVAWPIGGMVCGIVTLIWTTFGRKED